MGDAVERLMLPAVFGGRRFGSISFDLLGLRVIKNYFLGL
jgi:hypothetical protein